MPANKLELIRDALIRLLPAEDARNTELVNSMALTLDRALSDPATVEKLPGHIMISLTKHTNEFFNAQNTGESVMAPGGVGPKMLALHEELKAAETLIQARANSVESPMVNDIRKLDRRGLTISIKNGSMTLTATNNTIATSEIARAVHELIQDNPSRIVLELEGHSVPLNASDTPASIVTKIVAQKYGFELDDSSANDILIKTPKGKGIGEIARGLCTFFRKSDLRLVVMQICVFYL